MESANKNIQALVDADAGYLELREETRKAAHRQRVTKVTVVKTRSQVRKHKEDDQSEEAKDLRERLASLEQDLVNAEAEYHEFQESLDLYVTDLYRIFNPQPSRALPQQDLDGDIKISSATRARLHAAPEPENKSSPSGGITLAGSIAPAAQEQAEPAHNQEPRVVSERSIFHNPQLALPSSPSSVQSSPGLATVSSAGSGVLSLTQVPPSNTELPAAHIGSQSASSISPASSRSLSTVVPSSSASSMSSATSALSMDVIRQLSSKPISMPTDLPSISMSMSGKDLSRVVNNLEQILELRRYDPKTWGSILLQCVKDVDLRDTLLREHEFLRPSWTGDKAEVFAKLRKVLLKLVGYSKRDVVEGYRREFNTLTMRANDNPKVFLQSFKRLRALAEIDDDDYATRCFLDKIPAEWRAKIDEKFAEYIILANKKTLDSSDSDDSVDDREEELTFRAASRLFSIVAEGYRRARSSTAPTSTSSIKSVSSQQDKNTSRSAEHRPFFNKKFGGSASRDTCKKHPNKGHTDAECNRHQAGARDKPATGGSGTATGTRSAVTAPATANSTKPTLPAIRSVCTHCEGRHPSDKCWKKFPELRPQPGAAAAPKQDTAIKQRRVDITFDDEAIAAALQAAETQSFASLMASAGSAYAEQEHKEAEPDFH